VAPTVVGGPSAFRQSGDGSKPTEICAGWLASALEAISSALWGQSFRPAGGFSPGSRPAFVVWIRQPAREARLQQELQQALSQARVSQARIAELNQRATASTTFSSPAWVPAPGPTGRFARHVPRRRRTSQPVGPRQSTCRTENSAPRRRCNPRAQAGAVRRPPPLRVPRSLRASTLGVTASPTFVSPIFLWWDRRFRLSGRSKTCLEPA
jgi:hypothetical protein